MESDGIIMKTDSLGIHTYSTKDLVDMIYSVHVDKCHVVICDKDDEIDKFNKAMREEGLTELSTYIPLDVDQKTFDGVCQSDWFMPEEYKNFLNGLMFPFYLIRLSFQYLNFPLRFYFLNF